MRVEQLAPVVEQVEVEAVIERARASDVAAPFAAERMAFCSALSAELLGDPEARLYPELQAVGFSMRASALARLKSEFEGSGLADCIAAPRGLVFHIPPSNVATVWLYSWLYAFLTGNRNVIRVGRVESPQRDIMLRLLREISARFGGAGAAVLRYGHCQEITGALSAAADVRVIWGGDETVSGIRAIPIPPHARELTFPDRSSMAAIRTEAYLDCAGPARDELAGRFFNDVYQFDQMACSSPRLLVWCGPGPEADEASRDFYPRLRDRITRKRYASTTAAYLAKTTYGWGAILDTAASRYEEFGNELSVLTVETPEGLPERHSGGGLLFQCAVPELATLLPFVRARHQTLGVFGFDRPALEAFARSLCGRGIDRIVPIGSALSFHRIWDGLNLLEEFTRRVYLSPQAVGKGAARHVA
jgi:Acyl-CoA reductase (LuxC)